MSDATETVSGTVEEVRFRPGGRALYYLTLVVRNEADCTNRHFQIDDARCTANGREMAKRDLIAWLTLGDRPLPRVILRGNFSGYPTCESADFTAPGT